MDHWTEIRTAYVVARTGTVSKAAQELGLHRATVSRHVDALEGEIGARLFLRHRRGYELTDVGREFMEIAERSYDMLEDFFGRVRVQSADVEGQVIVATLFPLTDLILPAILEFRRRHPKTRVRVTTGDELARLEFAEAHVALRVGSKATNEDYVVQPFCTLDFSLFAHRGYIDRFGKPEGHDLTGHALVGNPDADSGAPFEVWIARNVDPEQLVLVSANPKVLEDAVRSGEGIGFMPVAYAQTLPDLEQVVPALPEWQVQSWLVTHVDVHRTDKVQSMLGCLKSLAFAT
ncbi:MAG: LysR family transcriptional regulator [Pseudomonadota bacterium]